MLDPNPHQLAILYVLKECKFIFTTAEISKRTGMSNLTAKKYLEKLYKENYIIKIQKGIRNYWKI